MKNRPATAAAHIVIVAEQPYADASGFPATVSCGPYVFAFDFVRGEPTDARSIRETNGSRVERRIAVERCTAAYTKLVLERTTQEWRIANAELYAQAVSA